MSHGAGHKNARLMKEGGEEETANLQSLFISPMDTLYICLVVH